MKIVKKILDSRYLKIYSKGRTCLTSKEVRDLKKIIHQNITQQVIEYIKDNIESGNWKVGEKIPSENELTAFLGVSRSSVRQAVSHFAGIGILESVHGKGTYLIDDDIEEQSNRNKITAEDCRNVEKVLEFRRIIESEACYLAAKNSTPKLVEKLKKCLEIMVQSREDTKKYVAADINFHQAICHASGNPLLEKSMNRIFQENKKSQMLTRKTFGYNDGIYYHRLILKAIKNQDAEEARRQMFEHLQNGINKLPK